MNDQQIEKIDNEIQRLTAQKFTNTHIHDFATYVDGRIDSLKWTKENI